MKTTKELTYEEIQNAKRQANREKFLTVRDNLRAIYETELVKRFGPNRVESDLATHGLEAYFYIKHPNGKTTISTIEIRPHMTSFGFRCHWSGEAKVAIKRVSYDDISAQKVTYRTNLEDPSQIKKVLDKVVKLSDQSELAYNRVRANTKQQEESRNKIKQEFGDLPTGMRVQGTEDNYSIKIEGVFSTDQVHNFKALVEHSREENKGTAKSMVAKAAGNSAGVLTIKLDLGALKGGIVGESEANIRQALKVIQAVSGGKPFFVATSNSQAEPVKE